MANLKCKKEEWLLCPIFAFSFSSKLHLFQELTDLLSADDNYQSSRDLLNRVCLSVCVLYLYVCLSVCLLTMTSHTGGDSQAC